MRNKKGGEAPKGASSSGPRHTEKCCHLPVPGRGSASSGMRSPSGAPPRLLSQRPNASTQPRPRFSRSRGCGRYPHHQSRLSKAPCAPVFMPAGTMPGPPGSRVTSPARRNHSRSAIRCVSRSRPSNERDSHLVAETGTDVKGNVPDCRLDLTATNTSIINRLC